jgi:hypothetical protein
MALTARERSVFPLQTHLLHRRQTIEKLRSAVFTKPRGFFSWEQDLLVILRDGTRYEVGLAEGDKERALEEIHKMLEA